MTVPKIRSMRKAYDEIVKNDPDTSISYYNFRQLVLDGAIPSIKSGNLYLIDMDNVNSIFKSNIDVEDNNVDIDDLPRL